MASGSIRFHFWNLTLTLSHTKTKEMTSGGLRSGNNISHSTFMVKQWRLWKTLATWESLSLRSCHGPLTPPSWSRRHNRGSFSSESWNRPNFHKNCCWTSTGARWNPSWQTPQQCGTPAALLSRGTTCTEWWRRRSPLLGWSFHIWTLSMQPGQRRRLTV